MHVPAGFAVVAPYLVVDRADAYVAFLVDGLGGRHVGTSRAGDRVANAQIAFGDDDAMSTVMVSDAMTGFPAQATSLYLFVADADAAMARAVAHGATMINEVGDRPYGDRQGGVRDAWGTTWWLSQRLTADAYDFDH